MVRRLVHVGILMLTRPLYLFALLSLVVFLGIGNLTGQTQLIDVNFPPGTGTNATFLTIDNEVGGLMGTWDQASGVVTSTAVNNSTTGAASDLTIDFGSLGSDSLTLSVEVLSRTGVVAANGMFIGFQQRNAGGTGDDLWNNTPPSFGLVVPANASGGLAFNRVSVGGSDPSSPGRYQLLPGYGVATAASISDGFTMELRVDSGGWELALTGLEDGAGNAITGGSGDWGVGGVNDWAEFNSTMRVGFSYQTNAAGGALSFGSISVVQTSATDTDQDGMPDDYENANGLDSVDPADAAIDADANGGADGLTNLEEYLAGTNPQDSDSDNDGLSDGEEVNGLLNPWTGGVFGSAPGDATDPLEPDSDGDGDGDGLEITNGTDPNAPPPNTGPLFPFVDTDGDSYRDEAETAFGSDPSVTGVIPDHTPTPAKPNVVIIYADDMGLGDVSAYGNLFGTPSPATTPHMDALADEGVLFTQAHSGNGACTQSRYALLTGKYHWREFNGISSHYGSHGSMPDLPLPSDFTIAEFLKTQGYDTAAFGKWHLGGRWHSPAGTRVTNNGNSSAGVDWTRPVEEHAVANGFDFFRGLASTINFGPYVYLHDDRVQWVTATDANGVPSAFRDVAATDVMQWFTTGMLNSSVVGSTDSRASLGDPSYRQVDAGPVMVNDFEDYISDRVASADSDPFFAYVALYSPHKPWALTAPFVGADSNSGFHYADFMREVDDRMGRVIDAIDAAGFGDDTVVILTSDNGPENTAMSQSLNFGKDPNGPLRGNKRDVWEGGTRVPFIVRWPGQAAAGMKVSAPIWQGDIFATVAAFLGEELPGASAPDGESFLNLIRGQQKPAPERSALVVSSIRGDLGLKTTDGWKLIDGSGGGHATSWDSSNASIPNAAGTNGGVPKQLFHLAFDLGEDSNLISGLTNAAAIRAELTAQTGTDLLGTLDALRVDVSTTLYERVPDNDADGMPNAYELGFGLDPDWPLDAASDLDCDEVSNLAEYLAGTNPTDANDALRISGIDPSANAMDVSWPSVAGREYDLVWSTDLVTWSPVVTLAGDGSELSYTMDRVALGISVGDWRRVFVRVEVSVSP